MNKKLLFWLPMVLYLIDRTTKGFILAALNSGKCLEKKIFSFLSFRLQFNRGISWGMFHSDSSLQFILVTIMTIVVIVGLLIYTYYLRRRGNITIGPVFAIVGALSNLLDRFLYGGVVDFISFSYAGWSFPVFNLADVYIVFGVFFMLFDLNKES